MGFLDRVLNAILQVGESVIVISGEHTGKDKTVGRDVEIHTKKKGNSGEWICILAQC